MPVTAIRDVPDTAFLVAMDRAIESERPDALFRDPFAAKLAGDRGKEIADWRGDRAAIGRWSVAIRTVIIDDYVRQAVERGVDAIVNLGAGLDSRPYRLDLPKTLSWVEVDYPSIIDLKEERLADDVPTCEVERVKLDLSLVDERRALLAALAQRFENVLVLTEGVLPYLSVDDAGSLADDLKAVGNVREWVVDYFSPETIQFRKTMKRDFENAPFKFVPDDWHAFFDQHGWRANEKRFLVEEGQKRNRTVPLTEIERATVQATRAELAKTKNPNRFAGYFLMEPAA